TIHYGIHDVIGTIRGSDDGLDVAIHNAIIALVDKIRRNPFCKPDGEILDASLILIDAGYRTDAVYGACHKCGVGVMPIMGFGSALAKGAMKGAKADGILGAIKGGMEAVAAGLTASIFFGFLFALIFKAKTKKY
ncbi:MAG TPA: SpoVA/SpoVAEb family sporulation membrane protein, partial [Eubacteriales bacterium]|nr:SpoVA/SpoVAEb family sporulation membrane protein [Eubacteriales bacterium]